MNKEKKSWDKVTLKIHKRTNALGTNPAIWAAIKEAAKKAKAKATKIANSWRQRKPAGWRVFLKVGTIPYIRLFYA